MKMPGFCLALMLLLTLIPQAKAAENTKKLQLEGVCSGERRASFDRADQAAIILTYQGLAEEALSLRARAIAFLGELTETHKRGEPLSGNELRRLNEGAAALLAQRNELLKIAVAHEC